MEKFIKFITNEILYLPIVYIKSLNIDDLSFNDKFSILKKLCLSIIEKWNIKLVVSVSDKINPHEIYYLTSNHQGTCIRRLSSATVSL